MLLRKKSVVWIMEGLTISVISIFLYHKYKLVGFMGMTFFEKILIGIFIISSLITIYGLNKFFHALRDDD